MRRIALLGALVLLALGAGYAVYQWQAPEPGPAWRVAEPERVVYWAVPHQMHQVEFRLQNTSRRPLRILGSAAC